MKAIIVDDEPKAIDLLKSYLQHFNAIHLVATFRNGLKAFTFLSGEKVDLIFLDINMPHLSGISLSKMIPAETKVIFTTSYAEYAVESYEVAAVDYLLKPISLERFSRAVSKILTGQSSAKDKFPGTEWLMVKSSSKVFRLSTEEILYLEKKGNYITYHLADQHILARQSVNEALEQLPSYFQQAHKSYIVNLKQISSVEKDAITIRGTTLPVGALFKEKLMTNLGM